MTTSSATLTTPLPVSPVLVEQVLRKVEANVIQHGIEHLAVVWKGKEDELAPMQWFLGRAALCYTVNEFVKAGMAMVTPTASSRAIRAKKRKRERRQQGY